MKIKSIIFALILCLAATFAMTGCSIYSENSELLGESTSASESIEAHEHTYTAVEEVASNLR